MPNNVTPGNNPGIIKKSGTFAEAGITPDNVIRINNIGNPSSSYDPSETFNSYTSFSKNDGVNIVAKIPMDLTEWLQTEASEESDDSPYDALAITFFNNVTGAGGTLNDTHKNALNNLTLFLKSSAAGESVTYLSKCVEFFPLAGNSNNSLPLGLKGSYNGTLHGTVLPNGGFYSSNASGYMDSGINALTALGSNGAALCFDSYSNTVGNITDAGVSEDTGSDALILRARYTGDNIYADAYDKLATGRATATSTDSAGQWCMSRTGSSVRVAKGVSIVASSTGAIGEPPNAKIFFGALSQEVATIQFSNRKYRCFGVFIGLTDAQMFAVNTAMLTYRNQMGE